MNQLWRLNLMATNANISRGQRLNLTDVIPNSGEFDLGITANTAGLIIDFSCFGLDLNGKLSDESYMTFFNQPCTPCRGVSLSASAEEGFNFAIALERLPATINRLVMTAAIDGDGTMSQLTSGHIRFLFKGLEVARYSFTGSDFSAERALMLLEIYRKKDVWRISAIGQGFNGGLDALIKHFGGTVTESMPSETPSSSLPLQINTQSSDNIVAEESINAYCSCCFKKTIHRLIEQNFLRRNVYECTECKERTLKCRVCQNMARGGKWDEEFCAEHDGTIGSFYRLNMHLDDIIDYSVLFKRDSINIKKVSMIAALSVGGAVVLGPLAFAAAPAVGGAVGSTLIGLSGAAAKTAGLAAIGGGSLAAGGLGMAGGAAIVAATGAALGGTLGGVIANSYFRDVDGFSIELVKLGVGPKVVFIDGFLTEENPDPIDWKQSLSKIYPDNPWYYLRWESKRLHDIGIALGSGAGKGVAMSTAAQWAAMASKEAAKKLGPFGLVLSAFGVASNPWSIALVKAGQTGVLLADLIARTDSNYILELFINKNHITY
jgi:stress response protein SCP2